MTFSRKKPKNVSLLLYGGVACIALMGLSGFVLLGGLKQEEKKPAETAVADAGKDELVFGFTDEPAKPLKQTPPVPQTAKPIEPPPAAVEIADDGQTLWASPTQGPPLDLRYLASGAQMFLVVRPSALLGTSEGEKVLDALGPRGEAARDFVAQVAGVNELAEIERLLVAFYPTDDAPPQVAMVVTLREAVSKDQLLQAWHNPKAVAQAEGVLSGSVDGHITFRAKRMAECSLSPHRI